jgi:uncharacterized protein (DUF1501 family)
VTLVDRRTVLRSGALAMGALAVPCLPSSRSPRLVVVRLHGGADGLSMVAPWRDAAYRRARPTIALAAPGQREHAALDLDGTFGLHPRLAPLVPLFRARVLDVVPACGLATVARSHLVDGEALDHLLEALDRKVASRDVTSTQSIERVLTDVAGEVARGIAPRVTIVHSGGWDHHGGQRNPGGPLAAALDDLACGVASFARALGPELRHTTLATCSEFGRAVRENGFGGSEHGHATAMFLLGGSTRRGRVVGPWPGLEAGDAVRPGVLVEDVFARL